MNYKSISNFLTRPSVFWPIIFILLLSVSWELVIVDPLLKRDDRLLINPLYAVQSLSDYLLSINRGQIFDVQPVRDLSFMFNIGIEKVFGHGLFHFLNLIIWMGILFLVSTILRLLGAGKSHYITLILLAIHPSLLTTVFWVSSRKHLLAAFFIMCATFVTIKQVLQFNDKKNNQYFVISILFYLLSVLSQPITILWPLWHGFYLRAHGRMKETSAKVALCVMMMISICVGWLNHWYYSTLFLKVTGGEVKMISKFGDNIDFSIMGLGRSITQIFFPVSVSPVYYVGDWKNMLGIVIGVLFVYIIWKQKQKDHFLWLLLGTLPLVVVYGKITNIFVSDTYLILPGISVCILLSLILHKHIVALKKVSIVGFAILPLFYIQSIRWASAWETDIGLWTHAYRVERSPQGIANLAHYLIEYDRIEEAYQAVLELKDWDPARKDLPALIAKSIYFNKKLSVAQKKIMMEKEYRNDPWFNYLYALILAESEQWDAAIEYIQMVFPFYLKFGDEISKIYAMAKYFCLKSGRSECQAYIDNIGKDEDMAAVLDQSVIDNYFKQYLDSDLK